MFVKKNKKGQNKFDPFKIGAEGPATPSRQGHILSDARTTRQRSNLTLILPLPSAFLIFQGTMGVIVQKNIILSIHCFFDWFFPSGMITIGIFGTTVEKPTSLCSSFNNFAFVTFWTLAKSLLSFV